LIQTWHRIQRFIRGVHIDLDRQADAVFLSPWLAALLNPSHRKSSNHDMGHKCCWPHVLLQHTKSH
jgi:hypothetical protein